MMTTLNEFLESEIQPQIGELVTSAIKLSLRPFLDTDLKAVDFEERRKCHSTISDILAKRYGPNSATATLLTRKLEKYLATAGRPKPFPARPAPPSGKESESFQFLKRQGAAMEALKAAGESGKSVAERVKAKAATAAKPDMPHMNGGSTEAIPIVKEQDIVTARLNARNMAIEIGFSNVESVKVATAVSELARNLIFYAGGGKIEMGKVAAGGKSGIEIKAIDQGPGIPNLDEIMSGKYKSKTGLGKGLSAVKALMDHFEIDSRVGRGTTVAAVLFHK